MQDQLQSSLTTRHQTGNSQAAECPTSRFRYRWALAQPVWSSSRLHQHRNNTFCAE
jgi:hypothetical protein